MVGSPERVGPPPLVPTDTAGRCIFGRDLGQAVMHDPVGIGIVEMETAIGTADQVAQSLRSVAGVGLSEPQMTRSTGPMSESSWGALLEAVERERLCGLLTAAIETGVLRVTPGRQEQASAARRRAAYVDLALEAVLVETVGLLVARGIDYRVLKGPAMSRLDYPDPAMRSFGDIDLLIREEQYGEALAALSAAGNVRDAPELRDGFDRRFGKGTPMRTPAGFEVDLHRTPDRGPLGLAIHVDDLWARPATFTIGSEAFLTLPLEQRFLSVCFHAALGNLPARVAPLRDVAQLALCTDLRTDRVMEMCAAWRAEAVVARAVILAWDTLGLEQSVDIADWARAHTLSRAERRMMSLYLEPGKNNFVRSVTMLRSIPGFRRRLAYLLAVTFPSRRYLAAKGRGYLGHWGLARSSWRHSRRVTWREHDDSGW